MNLTLYFRLVVSVLFQPNFKSSITSIGEKWDYQTVYFHLPRVKAKDGFSVSMQIHNGNYCSSENGYREFGLTWNDVEFGFTSEHEPLMDKYAEQEGDTTETVGSIPVSVMEEVFEKHGGIDWEATLSVEAMTKWLRP